MVDLKPGDSVLYVPDACHWNDTDDRGQPLFLLLDARTGAPAGHLREGISRDEQGVLRDGRGHALKVGPPVRFWPAKIMAMNPDGSADLEIIHPATHKYEYLAVRRSAAKDYHTWHVEGE